MLRRMLTVAVALLILLLPGAARADALKESIYVLGIHIGNADGVLFGLVNSYDARTQAHPAAVPLLHRQLRWTRDLAAALGLKTDDVQRLDKELDGLTFLQMRTRVGGIIGRLAADLNRQYQRQASPLFRLGVQITAVQGAIRLAQNVRPAEREGWRGGVATPAEAALSNIRNNRLEVDVSLADTLRARSATETYGNLATLADTAATSWQTQLGAAPAWAAAPNAPPARAVRRPARAAAIPGSALNPVRTSGSRPRPHTGGRPAGPQRSAGPRVTSSVERSFAGQWNTNWGVMRLVQQGSRVTGTYLHSDGTLQGTVTGNALRFQWSQKGNGHHGSGRFVLATDGRSFAGTWGYGDDPDKGTNTWNGTRRP